MFPWLQFWMIFSWLPKITIVWILVFTNEIGSSAISYHYYHDQCLREIFILKEEREQYRYHDIQLECKPFFNIGYGIKDTPRN